MTFRVGQKVVCVDDDWSRHPEWGRLQQRPVLNGIYTVRSVSPHWHEGGGTGLLLVEVRNPEIDWSDGDTCECRFPSRRFRPIVERKTDISELKALLVPGAKIREDA